MGDDYILHSWRPVIITYKLSYQESHYESISSGPTRDGHIDREIACDPLNKMLDSTT
jgi:hypothetical protein